jgi:hypothetical protein
MSASMTLTTPTFDYLESLSQSFSVKHSLKKAINLGGKHQTYEAINDHHSYEDCMQVMKYQNSTNRAHMTKNFPTLVFSR